MGLINYKDIDFNKSINKELITFDFNGSEIAVVPYLSINDKYDLVMITLQKSLEKGIYNPVKLDMYFKLHLVYMYTNIQIDTAERADEAELYDTMMRSGLIKQVIAHIDPVELEELMEYIQRLQKVIMKYRSGLGNIVSEFVEKLPEYIEQAKEVAATLTPEKMQEIKTLFSGAQQ